MDKIINGTALAKQHEEVLREKIKTLSKVPHVVSILVGDNPASLLYSNLKQKKAADVGIEFKLKKFPVNTLWDQMVLEVKALSRDPSVDGIMVQLPLPPEFLNSHQTQELLDKINPQKDVDGLTGKGSVLPATVKGILSILDSLSIDYSKKIFGVVGSEGAIGRGVVKALREKKANVIEIDKKKPDTSLGDIKNADVIISCTGDRNSITVLHIGSGTVLIDVGLGDFDPSCYEKASIYTPEKGGVGPMTVVSLMENAVELAEKERK